MNEEITLDEIKAKIQDEQDKEFKEHVSDLIRRREILCDMGLTKEESIEFMKLVLFEDIAGALYSEGDSLAFLTASIGDDIENISSCVRYTRDDGHRVCVTGDIASYEM